MSREAHDAQHVYARWLEVGSRAIFVFAVLSLVLYATGLLAPAVPLENLPRLWSLPAAEYLRQAQLPGGWGWLRLVRFGDYLNVLPIALFSVLSLVCSARVVPAFARSGERTQAWLAALQVLVLLVAASGLAS
jgi:hypothetical protein